MSVDAENLLLMVDPSTLETSLEHERCWMCADTDDDTQKETRLIGAVQMFSQPAANDATTQSAAFNAGLSHSIKDGSFITGDLCPSRKPLDRDLLDVLKTIGSRTPVALAISGLTAPISNGCASRRAPAPWRSPGSTIPTITPMSRAAPLANNFLLTPGFDIQSEILDTERLLIANGETPSIFFRFPGLVSDAALMQAVRRDHLVVLGARRLAGLCAAAAAGGDPAHPPERQRASRSAALCEVARQG
jgi:hypothetical protein